MNRREFIKKSTVSAFLCSSIYFYKKSNKNKNYISTNDEWRTLYYDSHNTNHNPHATPPTEEPRVVWCATDHVRYNDTARGDSRFSTPTPTIINGRLYLGGFGVSCYNATTGRQLWDQESSDRFVVGTAAAAGQLYASERLPTDSPGEWPEGKLSIVNTVDGTRDTVTNCGTAPLTPVTDGSLVVVPTRGGQIGFDSDGKRSWQVKPGAIEAPSSPPAFTDKALLFPLPSSFARHGRPSGLIGALTGPQWQWRVNQDPMKRWFPPTILPDGSAIVPLVKHRSSPTETPATPRVGLHAYGPDGTLQWHRPIPTAWAVDDDDQLGPTPEYRVSTPAIMNGIGYAVATLLRDEESTDRYPARADATLLAFDTATGAERWRVTFPGEGTEAVAPVVANGRVYAVVPSEYGNDDAAGRLVAYDQQGEQLWSVNLPGSAYHLAAVGNLLYVTLGDGGVIAYGPA